jgi:hypothetical protein
MAAFALFSPVAMMMLPFALERLERTILAEPLVDLDPLVDPPAE